MSYFINNEQRLNDVIFNGRNKEYGAYAIRSSYGNTVFKSLSIVVLGFGSLMSLALYLSNKSDAPEEQNILPLEQETITTIFDLKKDEPIAEAHSTPAENPPASDNKPAENSAVSIVDSTATETRTVINEPVADPNLLASANPNPGNTGGNGNATVSSGTTSGGGGTSPEIAETYLVDQEPEFEGGLKALIAFVSKNVRYPALAAEEGKQGTVYVKFVVDEKGKVSHVTLLNNLGYGLDEEAKRVVSIIPAFKSPALVHGKPVKVYYQLPIRFRLR